MLSGYPLVQGDPKAPREDIQKYGEQEKQSGDSRNTFEQSDRNDKSVAIKPYKAGDADFYLDLSAFDLWESGQYSEDTGIKEDFRRRMRYPSLIEEKCPYYNIILSEGYEFHVCEYNVDKVCLRSITVKNGDVFVSTEEGAFLSVTIKKVHGEKSLSPGQWKTIFDSGIEAKICTDRWLVYKTPEDKDYIVSRGIQSVDSLAQMLLQSREEELADYLWDSQVREGVYHLNAKDLTNSRLTFFFSATEGDDNNSGLDEEHPKKTLTLFSGVSNVNLLLKCGDDYEIGKTFKCGNDSLYAAYGCGPRPRLDFDGESGFVIDNVSDVAIKGLEIVGTEQFSVNIIDSDNVSINCCKFEDVTGASTDKALERKNNAIQIVNSGNNYDISYNFISGMSSAVYVVDGADGIKTLARISVKNNVITYFQKDIRNRFVTYRDNLFYGSNSVNSNDHNEIEQILQKMSGKGVPPSKVLVIGNSITMGFGTHGMASTDIDTDYYYLISQYIKEYNPNVSINRISGKDWEQGKSTEERQNIIDLSILPNVDENTDLIIVQLGDNTSSPDEIATFTVDSLVLLKSLCIKAPKARILWVFGRYNLKNKNTIASACEKCGAEFVDVSIISTDKKYMAEIGDQYVNSKGTISTIKNAGIASHPNDLGMKTIAELIIQQLNY